MPSSKKSSFFTGSGRVLSTGETVESKNRAKKVDMDDDEEDYKPGNSDDSESEDEGQVKKVVVKKGKEVAVKGIEDTTDSKEIVKDEVEKIKVQRVPPSKRQNHQLRNQDQKFNKQDEKLDITTTSSSSTEGSTEILMLNGETKRIPGIPTMSNTATNNPIYHQLSAFLPSRAFLTNKSSLTECLIGNFIQIRKGKYKEMSKEETVVQLRKLTQYIRRGVKCLCDRCTGVEKSGRVVRGDSRKEVGAETETDTGYAFTELRSGRKRGIYRYGEGRMLSGDEGCSNKKMKRAGDIAAAITLAYNLIQALDSCDGAASDYRDAVSFLQDLNRTLEPLQTFTTINANPTYGRDITEQVTHIKEPVERFLEAVLKDAIQATQQQLTDNLRVTLQQTLRPELIAVLHENLPSLNKTILDNYLELHTPSQNIFLTKWTEHYEEMSRGIREIKADMKSSSKTQMRIQSSLGGYIPRGGNIASSAVERPADSGEDVEPINRSPNISGGLLTPEIVRGSLMEVYYLAFLYLGHFLRNLFLVLSRLVQPTKALMPVLQARYNISFLDAIGRPPRVLPFEYFRCFQVLRAFIEYEFKDLPGSAWVNRGRYLVLNLKNNRTLDEHNWSGNVAPGVTIAMSIIVSRLRESSNSQYRCPESSCPGKWTKLNAQSWFTCPVCQKQILNYLPEVIVQDSSNDRTLSDPLEYGQHANIPRSTQPMRSTAAPNQAIEDTESELDEDISPFKRIVQKINLLGETSNTTSRRRLWSPPGFPISAVPGERPPWEPKLKSTNSPVNIPEQTPLVAAYDLPCEFSVVDCHMRFYPEHFESWISHSLSHFSNHPPPSKTICTFCDREFDLVPNENNGDPFSNWRERMLHIGGHFFNHRELGTSHPRPDYFLLDYLRDKGFLRVEVYEDLISYIERPHCDDLYPLGFKTPEMIQKKARSSRESLEICDLKEEKRAQRKKRRSYSNNPSQTIKKTTKNQQKRN
ncbi:hypothetical protein G7Y89_g2801 [Cudoniella acicularis]|uniref:Ubiquitin-like domain-containing protein n=1 Tax=Cudoniella acicularis TaxID=354080 RepID=A0A8H4RSP9_9HELO|nr:hypothetical protein G7Y89_g2801 [Cudoniella acicularis]